MNRCIERARGGCPKATKRLVEALHPRIRKMAYYYARCCGEDPDDLLQEAWVGFLDGLKEIDLTIGRPEQYLIQRARWRMLDTIKRAKVRRCAPLEHDDINAPMTSHETAVAEACASEFADNLQTNQRAVLDCLLDGLTWREAGSTLGCTSANIAYHVRQIRRRYEEWVE